MLPDLIIIVISGLVLLAGLWIGFRIWIKPHVPARNWQARAMLLVFILTMEGGFIGAFAWWAGVPGSFAWNLPPLAGRMLGAAAWCFALAAFLVLQRPTRQRARLLLWMHVVYLAPLAVAVVLFHLDRFNFNAPITYPFFAVVLLFVIAAVWCLLRQPAVVQDTPHDTEPASVRMRAWSVVVAAITGLWGLALFVTDKGPSTLIWVWPGDLLTSRLIGVMLLTIATGALTTMRYADVSRVMLGVIVLYGLGLAVASAWNGLAGKPVPWTYLFVFTFLLIGSLVLLALERPAAPQPFSI